MQAKIISCRSCGCTGEDYVPALMGDGWTGKRCYFCGGQGTLLYIDGKVFQWGPSPNTYRGKDGRFKSLENIEVMG